MTTVIDRHEQRKSETRQRLVEAAQRVFSQVGYEAASVLDITEAANVSKRTFYLHFVDKESVIETLALQSFMELRQRAEAHEMHFNTPQNYRQGLYTISRLIFEFVQQNPDLMQIVFGKDGSFRLQAMAREFITQAWEENITRKCEYKPDAPIPAKLLAHGMAGVIFQLMCWWSQYPSEYTPDQMATMCVSFLCDGVEINFLTQEVAPMT